MRRRMPPLNALKTFDAVGRWGSVRLAADELCVTEPAVSRAIKSLEDHFDVALFHRKPRGLELTEHGKLLLPGISEALDGISEASRLVYSHKRYHLSILATPHIASYWLSTRLAMFNELHDDIDIFLSCSFRHEVLFQRDFDVAIWWGDCPRESYDRQPLFSRRRIPYCSRSYLQQAGGISTPEDLLQCTLLHEYDYNGWAEWFDMADIDDGGIGSGMISDNFDSLLRAAVHGVGVALLFDPLLSEDSESAELVAPVGREIGLDTEYSAVYRRGHESNPAIGFFLDFLLDEVEKLNRDFPQDQASGDRV